MTQPVLCHPPIEILPGLPDISDAPAEYGRTCLPFSSACTRNIRKNLITLSPADSLFFTFKTLNRHRFISLMKSPSSNWLYSSSCRPLLGSGCSKQHRSCSFRREMVSLRCVAVVFCASLKIWHICVRSNVSGPSSGISTAFAEARAERDARDLRVAAEDLRPVVVFDEREERVVALPGIL